MPKIPKIELKVLSKDIDAIIQNTGIRPDKINGHLYSRIIALANTIELTDEEVKKELEEEAKTELRYFTINIKDESVYLKLRLLAKRNLTTIQSVIHKYEISKKV